MYRADCRRHACYALLHHLRAILYPLRSHLLLPDGVSDDAKALPDESPCAGRWYVLFTGREDTAERIVERGVGCSVKPFLALGAGMLARRGFGRAAHR
jgi:hypothetical protein